MFIFHGTDKSVFLYIGRMMTEGKIPYLDLFDHKGIVLYFIQYLGSIAFPRSAIGVWILEIVNILITIWGTYKIYRLFSNKNLLCFFTTIFVCFYLLSNVIEGGNFVEEWALPWITWSLFIFFRFIETRKYEWWDIVILGAACAVIMLLRVNMVGVWATFLPVIIVILAKKKRGREIALCSGYFAGGMILVFLPNLLWCYEKKCISAFWEDYILFNFSYADAGISFLSKVSNVKWLFKLFPLGMAVLIVSFFVRKKGKAFWLNALFFCVNFVFANISGRMWKNYLIIMLPAFVIFCMTSFDFLFGVIQKINLKPFMRKLISYAGIVFLVCTIALETVMIIHRTKPENSDDMEIIEYIQNNTALDADVLFLGNYAEMNIRANQYTDNKYYFQYPPITIDTKIENEFIDSLRQNGPDYVIDMEYTKSSCNWIKCETDMKSSIEVMEQLTIDGAYRKVIDPSTNLVVYAKE